MAFATKDWKDAPSKSTPISAVALEDMEKRVTDYTDVLLSSADAVVYKGAIDCSTNPNYPAADAGHVYRVSVAGKIGGASGTNVDVGDTLLCNTDGAAEGTQAGVGSKWNVIQANLDGAVIGPASATSGDIATFSGTTGKLLQDGGVTISSLATKAEIEAITPEGGDSVIIYTGSTDPAKRAMHLKVGTEAAPDETYGAPIRVSRTLKVAESQFTGDGNMGLGAISGVTIAVAGSQGQALGGVFGAITHSTYVGEHSQADAFAFYAVGRSASDSTRTGGGGFILAQRNHVEGRATGLELTVENNASADGAVLANEYMNTMGFWVTPRGTKDSAAAFVIGHPTSRVFKVGWMAQTGSISEATWRDYSNSTTSLDIRGEHTNSIKLAEAAGPVDLGKNSITNPGTLGNPYRIISRVTGNANTSAAEGTKYFLISGQTNASAPNPQSTVAVNQPYLIIIAGADMAGPGTTKMRTSAVITTAATPPGKTITVGLYPVTGAPTQSLGTVVTGSTLAFESPAKESNLTAKSGDYTPPADGIYAVGYIVSGTPAGGFALQAAAEYHHV